MPSRAARTIARVLLAATIGASAVLHAQPVPAPAPTFDVAYRAWEVVTGIARHERDPALAGECGRSFQAAAVPALRRQTKAQQDAAAIACHQQARALCAGGPRTPGIAAQCAEFK